MNLKKLEKYLRVNLLGPGPRLIKKNLPGRGLTKVEKHCYRRLAFDLTSSPVCATWTTSDGHLHSTHPDSFAMSRREARPLNMRWACWTCKESGFSFSHGKTTQALMISKRSFSLSAVRNHSTMSCILSVQYFLGTSYFGIIWMILAAAASCDLPRVTVKQRV